MRVFAAAALLLVAALPMGGCRFAPASQSETSALKEEVRQLRERVQGVEKENRVLRDAASEQSRELEALRKAQEQEKQIRQGPVADVMTLDRMRRELEQPLQEAIRKVKKKSETAPKGNQFGLRLEYHLQKAVYGLIRKDDPATPYLGKVLVPCERFLESAKESKSYGESSTEFLFSYSKGKWKLESYKS